MEEARSTLKPDPIVAFPAGNPLICTVTVVGTVSKLVTNRLLMTRRKPAEGAESTVTGVVPVAVTSLVSSVTCIAFTSA